MKKRIIAVVLTAALVAGGLGSFVFAQEDPVNEVGAGFVTQWKYFALGDTFNNDYVTGEKEWGAHLHNNPDETGLVIATANLTLDSDLAFDCVHDEYLTTEGPPTYEWSFGDVPEGSDPHAYVGFWSPHPFPVTFTPGFNASRLADITEFLQSDGMQVQTLTIEVTPQAEMQWLGVGVDAAEDEFVNPVIISATSEEADHIHLDPDGHHVWISQDEPVIGDNLVITVIIEVTPKVAELEFMPEVLVEWPEMRDSGNIGGSSVSHAADPGDDIGTWTWSAVGEYAWHWEETRLRRVIFPRVMSMGNEVGAEFITNWGYRTSGDAFTNQEVTGEKHWYTWLNNRPDDTGELVYEPNVTLDSDLTFDGVHEEYLTTMGPPTYVWSFDDVPEDDGEDAGVDFWSPQYPVTFTPGFNASRLADITEFLQSDGMQVQTLTIEVTPLEEMKGLGVGVGAWEDDFVNPVIISATADGAHDIDLAPDGHYASIWQEDPVVGDNWTITVVIEVTPKVGLVEFMPEVRVEWPEDYNSGTISGSSVSRTADPDDEIGTWTWSAVGEYAWQWYETRMRRVTFPRVIPISVTFGTSVEYYLSEDTFTNEKVTGRKIWFSDLWTEAPATALELSLDSELEFDEYMEVTDVAVTWEPEYLTTVGPPTYEWSFGDVLLPSYFQEAVSFQDTPREFEVKFTPGFDASRSVDVTEFTTPETQTQTITVTITSRQEGLQELLIWAAIYENDLADALIISPEVGHSIAIWAPALELNETWTTTITIQVTPKVFPIEFTPGVYVCLVDYLDSGTTSGSSVSHAAGDPGDEIGTWTWRAEGSHNWQWKEQILRVVGWPDRSEVISVPHEPMIGQKLITPGYHGRHEPVIGFEGIYEFWTLFHITNPDCVSEIAIDRISILDSYGRAIYDGAPWPEPMKPHESRSFTTYDYVPEGTGEWMYTVEILWTWTDREGLPLTGWAYHVTEKMDNEGSVIEFTCESVTPMVNMEQKLLP